MKAFEEIVAENGVLGDAILDRPQERGHVVDALAGENAGAEHILVHVGGRAGVDVDGRIARIEMGEMRRGLVGRQELEPGLQNGVSPRDPPGARIEPRPVQRVRKRPDQTRGRSRGQFRVGIENDGEHDPFQAREIALGLRKGGLRLRSPGQEGIEGFQFAALALPAHPTPLGRVEAASAMQEHERPALAIVMTGIQGPDGLMQTTLDAGVAGLMLFRRVRQVGQKDEAQRRVPVGQPPDLQFLGDVRDLVFAADNHRDDDRGRELCRDRLAEVQLREDTGADEQRDQPVHHRNAENRRGQHRQKKASTPLPEPRLDPVEVQGRHQKSTQPSKHQGAAIERISTCRQIAPHGAGPRQSAPKHSLEIGEPVVDQPIPDVTRLRAGFGLPCEPQRLMRHLEFRAIGKVGQVLDGRSVPVARLECHDAVDVRRILSQGRFDAAGPIDHVGPFDGLHADQGGQGIRHRHRGVAGRSPRGFGSWLERRSKVWIEQAERGHEPIKRDQTHHRWQGPKLRVGQHGDILIGVQVLRQRLHRNLVPETIRQILRQGEHSWNTPLRRR